MSGIDPAAFGQSGDRWTLAYEEYRTEAEGLREALCAVGNGYFVTRAASAQNVADGVHYPGTYLAGGFNRLVSNIAGRAIENEDLVNMPNWLPLTFRIGDGPQFNIDSADLLQYRQELDLRKGVMRRSIIFRDDAGRETELTERRFVSMADKNLAALEVTLTARNWAGRITFTSALDGSVVNAGVPRYRDLASDHLKPISTSRPDLDTVCLVAETSQSHIRIAEAARTQLKAGDDPVPVNAELIERTGYVGQVLPAMVQRGRPLTIEKTVALFTSRESGISEPAYAALVRIKDADDFSALLERHVEAWEAIWRRCSIDVGDDDHVGMLLHLHTFHVLQTVSPHTIDLDAGLPARGLHGEAYRGHIFWDELYVFPFLTGVFPEITRALLMYRYRRLPAAVRAARVEGFRGAMFPWQSGSDGREETQVTHLNPKSGHWVPDNSRIQRHVNVAIAYNIWRYCEMTGDVTFLRSYGAEMLLQIARFLASLTSFDEASGRFVIRGVMGPDEYHDAYPWSDKPGIDNNAYTNIMTSWVLQRALDVLGRLPAPEHDELARKLDIDDAELDLWRDVSHRLFVPFLPNGVISQFEGYEQLEEFDWSAYKTKHSDIGRLDRILGAEGDAPNRYRLSKQPDVLMLLYLFPIDEVQRLLAVLGYEADKAALLRTVEFYAARTSHGSTLSRVVHAWLLARSDPSASWSLFLEALESDLYDIQGGTTPEGIHLGIMAGTVDLVRRGFAGVEPVEGGVLVDPRLPPQLASVRYSLLVRECWLDVDLTNGQLTLSNRSGNEADVRVKLRDQETVLSPGRSMKVPS
ncbi:MAG: glycoside hydrolase family 65 protein [Halobacteriota archaeon]